ncbi:NPC1-like intracellular cholesterol transporter 1 [Synchiropus splendidus]|uniref:NPC1-like intracellular cholesterol transporter 1 n=1 Tax=Synchiropus splendidus TaxID=270530 RepID=UPI00237EA0FC|nr:NPC1-like intracellular cholesterol transporter 1 [Synchiropus splendidus]
MVPVPVLLLLLTYTVLSEAQHHAGYCAFYDECGLYPTIGGSLLPPYVPCLDYSKARPLRGAHYKKLQEVCPMLDRGEGNTFACCSFNQLNTLATMLSLSKVVLHSCPSCTENYVHMHCINTCSPNQSQSVKVTKVSSVTSSNGETRKAVVGYQAYLSNSFAEAAFQSCRNVRIPSTGGNAIATMCGEYGAKLCTAQRWYDFQGDPTVGLSPLDIDFMLINPGDMIPYGMVPYSGRALRCHEATPTGGEVCSCQDCPQSCPSGHTDWQR